MPPEDALSDSGDGAPVEAATDDASEVGHQEQETESALPDEDKTDLESKSARKSRSPKRRVTSESLSNSLEAKKIIVKSSPRAKSRSPKRPISASPAKEGGKRQLSLSPEGDRKEKKLLSPVPGNEKEGKRQLSLSPEGERKRFSKTSPSTELRNSKKDKSPDIPKQKHSPIIIKGFDDEESER